MDFVVSLPTETEWNVNDEVWAVELLREGKNGQEHVDRFNENGIYSTLPVKAGCKAVIDFHTSSAKDFQRLTDVHYVFFSDDWSSAQYYQPGADAFKVILLRSEDKMNPLRVPENELQSAMASLLADDQ